MHLQYRARSVVALAAALIGGQHAAAAIEQQTVTYSLTAAPSSPFSLTFTPALRDGQNKALQAVFMTFEQTLSASVSAENQSSGPVPKLALELTSTGTVTFPGATLDGFDAELAVYSAPGLAPADGVAGQGADFYDFGVLEQHLFATDVIFFEDPGGADAFCGDFPLETLIDISFGFTINDGAVVDLNINDLTIDGMVTLTYVFVEAPAPGSVLVPGGLALLTGVRRRRSRG